MSLLVGRALGKAYGALDVFSGVDLRIEAGDRIGFVGSNGAGKTTLLRVLAGVEQQTTGDLARKRGLTVGYLPQDPPPPGEKTLHEAMRQVFAGLIAQGEALAKAEVALSEAAAGNAPDFEVLLAGYGEAQAAFEAAGGYAYETRIRQVLGGLGFNEDEHAKPLKVLSGGERNRALLAQLLLAEPDLLLLDEPTNHLDLEAVEWLEETLLRWRGAMVVVAHDRYFLDRVATRIWDMDRGQLDAYRGNYSTFHRQREMRRERQRKEWAAQQSYVSETEEFIRRNLAGQRTKEAQGRRTRLERFLAEEAIERPQEARQVRLGLTAQVRSGDLVMATRNLVVGYDAPLFTCPDVEVRRTDRVALIGPNGAGKTTFLKTLLGRVPPYAGTVRLGASVQIGYLAQAQAGLNPEQTVLDAILDIENIPLADARNFLGRFLFQGDDVFRTIGSLSGGQRSRVALARLTLQGANFLLLDEPTNHLDIETQEILEEVLRQFPGTVLLVTHDRYLVQSLATHIWQVEGDRMKPYKGSYEGYLRARVLEQGAVQQAPAAAEQRLPDEERERSREERRQRRIAERRADEAAAVEAQVLAIEAHRDRLAAQLETASLAGDVAEVQRLGLAYKESEEELERLLVTWAELA
jgi:ATP-binding cassette subfamily F protein 3